MMDLVGVGGITDSGTTLTYKGSLLSAEDEGVLVPGMTVEVNSEVMLVTAVNTGANQLTVLRGQFGTAAAAHVEDDKVIFAPKYPRHKAEQAVANAIANLSPPLFALKTSFDFSVSGTPTDAPADLYVPVRFNYQYNGDWSLGAIQLLDPFPDSNTDKALLFPGAPSGATGHLSYLAKFTFPENTTDLLTDLGLEPDHQRLVTVDAMIELLSDQDSLTVDNIHEALEAQAVPVGARGSLRRQLIQYYEYLMNRARRRQAALHPHVVENSAGVVLP